jgi:hypothetical protein
MSGVATDALLFLGGLIIVGIAGIGLGAQWPRLQPHFHLMHIVLYAVIITFLIKAAMH